jgi:beta-glucosidase-like glycosyl hydrolase
MLLRQWQALHENDSPHLLAAACCKHFAANDLENIPTSRQLFDAHVDARNMWETYLPAFRSCVMRGGARQVCRSAHYY